MPSRPESSRPESTRTESKCPVVQSPCVRSSRVQASSRTESKSPGVQSSSVQTMCPESSFCGMPKLCNHFRKIQIIQVLIDFRLIDLSRGCSKRIYSPLNYLNKTADGESLDLYLKSLVKKTLFIKSHLF